MAASLSPERLLQIHEANVKIKRMASARFYFKSSEYYQQDLSDTRSNSEYFKILEDNRKPSDNPDKKKIRQTICRIWRCIEEIKSELLLTKDNMDLFFINNYYTIEMGFIDNILKKGMTRWPRIYVDDSKYNGNADSLILLEVIPERYMKDGSTESELECNLEEFEEVKYESRPENKFSYNNGKINLSSVRKLTMEIERLIMEKLSEQNLFKNRSSNGFSVHHIIPRKKLEIFNKFCQRFSNRCRVERESLTLSLDQSARARAVCERAFQSIRMAQLYEQFLDKGLMTTIKSYNKQTCDSELSPSGNVFYGPQHRSDDEQNGFRVDKAAALVLSGKEYESIIRLDDELNEFLNSSGLRISELPRSATIDDHTIDQLIHTAALSLNSEVVNQYTSKFANLDLHIYWTFDCIRKNHGLVNDFEPIKFDPRLVDRDEVTGESKWFYRRRKIVGESLPNWYQTILRYVSQKLQIPLEIDLNLVPVEDAKNGVDENQCRQPLLKIQPLDYISDGREIYVVEWKDFVADSRVIYKFSEAVLDVNGPRD